MEIRVPHKLKEKQIADSLEIFEIMQKILLREDRILQSIEHFWVIGLMADRKISYIELISLGKADLDCIDIGDVFQLSLRKHCQQVYLIHNHKRKDLNPSDDEIEMTDKLYQSARFLKRKIVDHLIISTKDYFSYVKNGLFEQIHHSKKFMIRAIAEEIYRNEGIEIGKEEGLREGEKKGKEEGLKEKAVEMAKALRKKEIDITIIAETSGLSKEEIKKL